MTTTTTRADKAKEIRAVIFKHWRTASNRQIANIIGCSNRTIGKHRKAMEEAGEILPRFESTHPIEASLHEVCTSAIRPAPENDQLYDPVNTNSRSFAKLVDSIDAEGVLEPIVVSADGYVLSGHRRLAAVETLNISNVPVRVRYDVSYFGDRDQFVQLLAHYNTARVKTAAEQVREEVVLANPEPWQRVCRYREDASIIGGGVQFVILHGEKKRPNIVEKISLRDAIIDIVFRLKKRWPISARKVHYKLLDIPSLLRNDVRGTLYENTKHCSDDVSDLLTRLRVDKRIPEEAIGDETRPVVYWDTHKSMGTFAREQFNNFLCNYWRDLMQSQPNHLEILCEKNTVAGDIRPVSAKYTIPMTSGRGYCSYPPRAAMLKRFKASGREKLIILAVTDHDPEGEDIPHAFGRCLRDEHDVPEDKLVIVKAALTRRQVDALPGMHEGQFAKKDGSRYKRFVEQYGHRVWELEAVEEETLQEIVEATVRHVIDVDAFEAERAKEAAEKRELATMRQATLATISGAIGDISA